MVLLRSPVLEHEAEGGENRSTELAPEGRDGRHLTRPRNFFDGADRSSPRGRGEPGQATRFPFYIIMILLNYVTFAAVDRPSRLGFMPSIGLILRCLQGAQ